MNRDAEDNLQALLRLICIAAVPLAGCGSTTGLENPPADCTPTYRRVSSFVNGMAACAGNIVTLPCGLPDGATAAFHQTPDAMVCRQICGYAYPYCSVSSVNSDGSVSVNCVLCVGFGRRPAGYADGPSLAITTGARSVIGRFFAHVAALEAASVNAFRGLVRELAVYGAPRNLRAAAAEAIRDEQHHVTSMTAIARDHGGEFSPPLLASSASAAPRSLEAIAVENAAEGCVRETFGALVATWQASAATDPDIARAMAVIAADETRHAEFSWALARWVDDGLDSAARARVAAARREAVEALRREVTQAVLPALVDAAGMPSAVVAQRLARGLAESLWSA